MSLKIPKKPGSMRAPRVELKKPNPITSVAPDRRGPSLMPKQAPIFWNTGPVSSYAYRNQDSVRKKKKSQGLNADTESVKDPEPPPPTLESYEDGDWRPEDHRASRSPSPPYGEDVSPRRLSSSSQSNGSKKKRRVLHTHPAVETRMSEQTLTIRARAAENLGKILGGTEYGEALEKRIWNFTGGKLSSKYGNKVRELLYTLENVAEIKEKVLNGKISLKRLAKMSTEDLASSELAEKRKKMQEEAMAQSIVKEKHFLGRRGQTALLGDRNDVVHEDPELNRKVDVFDIRLGAATTANKKVGAETPKEEAVENEANVPEEENRQSLELQLPKQDSTTKEESGDEAPDLPPISPPLQDPPTSNLPTELPQVDAPIALPEVALPPVGELPAISNPEADAPAPLLDLPEVSLPDESELPEVSLPDVDNPTPGNEISEMEIEPKKEAVEGESESEEEDSLKAPEPEEIRAPTPPGDVKEEHPKSKNKKKSDSKKSRSFKKKKLPSFLKPATVPKDKKPLPRASLNTPNANPDAMPFSFNESSTSPLRSPLVTPKDKAKHKRISGKKRKADSNLSSDRKHKKKFKPEHLEWSGRLKDSYTKKTLDIQIKYMAGKEMNLRKMIPKSIQSNGRIRYTNIQEVIPMLKKKSQTKSHFLFRVSCRHISRKATYDRVWEKYEEQERGLVIDMKKKHHLKLYILPPYYDEDACQIDQSLVREIWGKNAPEGQPWGYGLYYHKKR